MKIELKRIPLRELICGYIDNNEDGVVGYGGNLDIRPKYQREFVYKDKQRDAVVQTVKRSFPLNVMYWAKTNADKYELLDGQQRTISICSYINGDFSINYQYFHNLTIEEQNMILDYELMVYICEGTDREKLEWFKIINIAGEKLTPQELRNAVYTGEWLTDAKAHFSKSNCAAHNIASSYMKGSAIRQEFLETALYWISQKDNIDIDEYMAIHQHDKDASELWMYFQNVINWVKVIFPKYRKEMKGIDWGVYYNEYKNNMYNPNDSENKVQKLMMDDDVTNKKGIYEYLIDDKEKHLSIRTFTPKMKREAFEVQKGICPSCTKQYELADMEADHMTPWSKGGKTVIENCQMLCIDCNRRKSGK